DLRPGLRLQPGVALVRRAAERFRRVAELEPRAMPDVEVLLAPDALDVLAHDVVRVPDPDLAAQPPEIQVFVAPREIGRPAGLEARRAEVAILQVQGADHAHDRVVAVPAAPPPQLGLVVPHVDLRDLSAGLEQAGHVRRAPPRQAGSPGSGLRVEGPG